MSKLLIYLIFRGTCREALEFYEQCLNGKIQYMRTFEGSPLEIDEEYKDYIFDAELKAGEITIKASDSLPENDITVGSNFAMFMTFKTVKEIREVYEKIQEGGNVIMALPEKEEEGAFCMVKDKYDIQWMLTLEV